jgi:hypothetical protein
VLAVVVVGRGAADDVAGGADAHIPQGGEGQGMSIPQLAWLDAKCVFTSGGTWVELAGGGRNNGNVPTASSHSDNGYFKSQYIELVITFLILNQKLCI